MHQLNRRLNKLANSICVQELTAISTILEHLIESEYRKYAEKGGHFEAESSYSQKEKLKKMNQALNELAGVIAKSLRRVLKRVAEREVGRIQDALLRSRVPLGNAVLTMPRSVRVKTGTREYSRYQIYMLANGISIVEIPDDFSELTLAVPTTSPLLLTSPETIKPNPENNDEKS